MPNWFGPSTRIETAETAESLRFLTHPVQRKIDVGAACVSFLGAVVAQANGATVWCFFLVIIACVFLGSWFSTTTRSLRVSQTDLRGDKTRLMWRNVIELRYESGGDGDPTGLFARTGRFSSTCLLEGVNREQCDEIQRRIYTKWPALEMAARPEPWMDPVKRALGIEQ